MVVAYSIHQVLLERHYVLTQKDSIPRMVVTKPIDQVLLDRHFVLTQKDLIVDYCLLVAYMDTLSHLMVTKDSIVDYCLLVTLIDLFFEFVLDCDFVVTKNLIVDYCLLVSYIDTLSYLMTDYYLVTQKNLILVVVTTKMRNHYCLLVVNDLVGFAASFVVHLQTVYIDKRLSLEKCISVCDSRFK